VNAGRTSDGHLAFLERVFRLLGGHDEVSSSHLAFIDRIVERLDIPRSQVIRMTLQNRAGTSSAPAPIPRERAAQYLPALAEAACADGAISPEVDNLLHRVVADLGLTEEDLREAMHPAVEVAATETRRLTVRLGLPRTGGLLERFPSGGKVALLFTDIKDSVRLFERHGDKKARELTLAHEEILRGCLAEAGGHFIERAGDAVFGAFRDPVRAVESALAMQEALRAWRKETESTLAIRIGVHVGDVIVERECLSGGAVNIAARVRDHADADEVIVSLDAHELLPPALADRFAWFGPCRPKGSDAIVGLLRWRAPWKAARARTKEEPFNPTTFAKEADLTEPHWRMDEHGESYRLSGVSPEVQGAVFALDGRFVTLGRADDCQLRVDAGRVGNRMGRRHAAFLVSRRQCWVLDLGGEVGTVITYPGEPRSWRVRSRAPLTVGTSLRLGSILWGVEA